MVETVDAVPVGQIRFERGDDGWDIDYSLDSAFRGWGLAAPMMAAALNRICSPSRFCARVKAGNLASARVFRQLGFAESTPKTAVDPYTIFTLTHAKTDHEHVANR